MTVRSGPTSSASMSTQRRISEILSEAAQTHHRVYRITDGADPDWATWYADWLIRLSPLPTLLGRTPVTSELVWLLVDLDRRYTMDGGGPGWEEYYARALVAHFDAVAPVQIEEYAGLRDALRELFALAEDSQAQLDSYLDEGRVLVARRGGVIIGHLQIVDTERPDVVEIKNMAVRSTEQRRGVGAQLVHAALRVAAAGTAVTVLVATAAADTGNLRFYQRQGFRFRSVERDAFTAATGYTSGTAIDGIPLRDRIWLDQSVEARPAHVGDAGPTAATT